MSSNENRWTILRETRRDKQGVHVWARCECGTEREIVRSRILRGDSRSCGCLTRSPHVTCTAPDCSRPHYATGYCVAHYQRMRAHGSLDDPRPAVRQRLLSQVRLHQGCWLWTGNISTQGYGRISISSRQQYAHRVSYELFVGEIPEGLHIDHLCRAPRCINPDHLEAVTPGENMRRGMAPTAILWVLNQCSRGHDLIQHGYIRPNGQGRICRVCANLRERAVAS